MSYSDGHHTTIENIGVDRLIVSKELSATK